VSGIYREEYWLLSKCDGECCVWSWAVDSTTSRQGLARVKTACFRIVPGVSILSMNA